MCLFAICLSWCGACSSVLPPYKWTIYLLTESWRFSPYWTQILSCMWLEYFLSVFGFPLHLLALSFHRAHNFNSNTIQHRFPPSRLAFLILYLKLKPKAVSIFFQRFCSFACRSMIYFELNLVKNRSSMAISAHSPSLIVSVLCTRKPFSIELPLLLFCWRAAIYVGHLCYSVCCSAVLPLFFF